MAKQGEETRRFTIELPLEVFKRLDPHLDWGMKRLLFSRLSNMTADVVDKYGEPGLMLLLAGAFEFKLNSEKLNLKGMKDE